jgi:hypothetical protein
VMSSSTIVGERIIASPSNATVRGTATSRVATSSEI